MGGVVNKLLFQPPEPSYSELDRINFWLYTTQHHKIPAYFIDCGAPLTVLFSHGNAEDIGMIFPWLRELSTQLQVNILAYDYSGYGISSHREPSEQACYANIEAAFSYLTDVRGIPTDRIVLFGRSLGSGPSCHLAHQQARKSCPVRGVILQCPLLSVFRVAVQFRFTMPGDMFANIDKVAHLSCPVCILHGMRDEVVPFNHGQQLYLELPPEFRARPLWVTEAGHNDIETVCGPLLFVHLARFLDVELRRAELMGESERQAAWLMHLHSLGQAGSERRPPPARHIGPHSLPAHRPTVVPPMPQVFVPASPARASLARRMYHPESVATERALDDAARDAALAREQAGAPPSAPASAPPSARSAAASGDAASTVATALMLADGLPSLELTGVALEAAAPMPGMSSASDRLLGSDDVEARSPSPVGEGYTAAKP